VGIYSDITSLKESERHLEQLAQRDALTGLPNRVPLMDRLQQALRAAERQHEVLVVAFVDLDGFKPVNDRHGHRKGDDVLIEVAQRLRRSVRAADTVCRVGGDEFVLLLRSLSSTDEAVTILERVRGEVAQRYEVDGVTIDGVTASIGYACFPDDAGEVDRLLSAADDAMYAGKRAGRDRVQRAARRDGR
jgi:diguanylate cyclase (GGDEF)-like protein